MTNHDVVKKLIGSITPVGETQTDDFRFQNLQTMCNLVHALVLDIDEMAYKHKDTHEFSVRRSVDFAKKFLKDDLGIAD